MTTYTWTTDRGASVEIEIDGETKKNRVVKSFTANGIAYAAKLDWMDGKRAVAFEAGTKTGYAIIPAEITAEIFAYEIKADAELKEYCDGYDKVKNAMSY